MWRRAMLWVGWASCLVIGVAGCASEKELLAEGADPGGGFEQIVLREIAASGFMEGGGVVARVRSIASQEPIRVWRYVLGQYIRTESAALERALGSDRGRWPRRTAYFSIERTDNDIAIVAVRVLYDKGLSATSRGGEAHTWEIQTLEGGDWEVREIGPFTVQD